MLFVAAISELGLYHMVPSFNAMEEVNLARLRKRRCIPEGPITKLTGRINEIASATGDPDVGDTAQRYKEKLIALDAEFKTHHYNIVDVVDDEEALAEEQSILDDHDDVVSQLMTKLQKIIKSNAPVARDDSRSILSRKLSHLRRAIESVDSEIRAVPEYSEDPYLVQQYDDRLAELKSELKSVHGELLVLNLEETDELYTLHSQLSRKIFDCCHQLKKLLGERETHTSREYKGVKLPKLKVPTFDGNVINWTTFWEQFSVSVHSRSNISDPEKLVYLQQALKDGSAKHAIEGLSRSADHYNEAVACLQQRYDRPRLIHRTHVQMIVETPSLKEGTGREIRRLHDKVQQHLRALKSMGQEPDSVHDLSVGTETRY